MNLEYWIVTLLPIIIILYINPKWRRIAKCYGKYLLFFLHLGVISIVGLPLCLKHPMSWKSMRVCSNLIAPVSKVLGVRFEIRHPEKLISNDKSALVIANHQSMFDVLGVAILVKSCSLRMGAIARSFFFWLWPFGLLMWMAGVVFIKRDKGYEKTRKRFNEAARQLFAKKNKLWVFVEGTRNKNPETLLPFKKGAFITAINNQVPLQPMVFSPFYFVDFENKRFDSGKIIVEIMDPISTEGLTHDNLDDLIARTYALMSEKHKQLLNEMKPCIEEYRESITQ